MENIDLRYILDQIILIRSVENALLDLFGRGKIHGTTHTCIGQELIPIAVMSQINKKIDIIFSNHRGHGHFVSYSENPKILLAEILGKPSGVCKGLGGSQHLYFRNFYSNGIQGGILPVCAGMAFAEKLNQSKAISVAFIGDGTLGQGILYETLNMSALLKLPILIIVENNHIAQSTSTQNTISGNITDRALAFNIQSAHISDEDIDSLYSSVGLGIEYVRTNSMPFFLVIDTKRLGPHSKGDDTRSREEISNLWARDFLTNSLNNNDLKNYIEERTSLRKKDIDEIISDLEKEGEGELADFVVPDTAYIKVNQLYPPESLVHKQPSLSLKDQLNEALKFVLEYKDVLFLGEDIVDPYGGAFKVSNGLSSLYPNQVYSTPISEAGIIGIAIGLALRGYKVVVEIMFGDFLTLGADQIINHAAKFPLMYNGNVKVPLTIRTPVGGGRGYGPTHSQSLEKIFCGIPGLKVISVSNRHNCSKMLFNAVINDLTPKLFLENKILYSKRMKDEAPPLLKDETSKDEYDKWYPTLIFRPINGYKAGLTIVTYGGMTDLIESCFKKIFHKYELFCDYIILSQLFPLDTSIIIESVKESKRLLVIEESVPYFGFADAIISEVAINFNEKAISYGKHGAKNAIIPNAKKLEEETLPSVESILNAIDAQFFNLS